MSALNLLAADECRYDAVSLGEVMLQLGAAHGVLAMTTPGDTSMASLADVRHLAAGGNARVDR